MKWRVDMGIGLAFFFLEEMRADGMREPFLSFGYVAAAFVGFGLFLHGGRSRSYIKS